MSALASESMGVRRCACANASTWRGHRVRVSALASAGRWDYTAWSRMRLLNVSEVGV
jgi:hypothetical protein